MDLSVRFLGKTAVDALVIRTSTPVLIIGRDRYTRGDLANVQCYNYIAALVLTKVLQAETSVKSVEDLFQRLSPSSLVLPRLGAVAFACLGAAFQLAGVGGANPLEAWIHRHQANPEATDYESLASLKRVQRLEVAQRQRRSRRTTGRFTSGRTTPQRHYAPQSRAASMAAER